MTSKNIDSLVQTVSAFQDLDVDDKLAVLGLTYEQIADEIPANLTDTSLTANTADLVAQIQQISPEEQLYALQELILAKDSNRDEVILDPHPTKAAIALAQGGTTIPTGRYGELNSEEKLAFWYLLGERLGSVVIGIPRDYSPSEPAKEVINSLELLNIQDLVHFFKQVL
ncbi:MAG: Orange carotenoid-binding protein [Goleter apudmare HA4340-LM2]|jgi:hypothetical protein|nr:Orange carotenoid-binding protein [Goleter apudmare HA4340-LM2]